MIEAQVNREEVYSWLNQVTDPEIPVVSIVEMGMVRNVEIDNQDITVTITPTYSGFPAMFDIRKRVVSKLRGHGFGKVKIKEQLSPAWTTDWMSKETLEKMRKFGIAPPEGKAEDDDPFNITPIKKVVPCPYCGSDNTKLKAEFSATACKSMHYCDDCDQPFEHFKCH